MNFIDFYREFKDYTVIKTTQVNIIFPNFNIRQLSLWQKKWYIKKLTKWLYYFPELEENVNQDKIFYIANIVNEPSYIGLQSALSYYNIIPEWVFKTTSISTKRINKITSDLWNFEYKTIKKSLFWWYKIKDKWKDSFYISDIEKTVLDFLYFYPWYKAIEDFYELRFNKDILQKIDNKKIIKYLKIFNNKQLEKRFNILNKYINA